MKHIIFFLLISFSSLANTDVVSISNLKVERTVTGMHMLKGIATNTSGKVLNNLYITYSFYDNDLKVQESPVHISKLDINEKWLFEATVVKPFDTYRLQEITSY